MQVINIKGKFSGLEIDRIRKVQMFVCFLGSDRNHTTKRFALWRWSRAWKKLMGCWIYVLGYFRGQKSSARTEGMAVDEGTGGSPDALSACVLVGEMVAESGRPLLSASMFFMRKYGLLLWMRREEGDLCFKEKKGDAQRLSTGDKGEHEPQTWAHIGWTLRTLGLHPWFWFRRWHWCSWLGPHAEDQWLRKLSGCLELSEGELMISEKRGTS